MCEIYSCLTQVEPAIMKQFGITKMQLYTLKRPLEFYKLGKEIQNRKHKILELSHKNSGTLTNEKNYEYKEEGKY